MDAPVFVASNRTLVPESTVAELNASFGGAAALTVSEVQASHKPRRGPTRKLELLAGISAQSVPVDTVNRKPAAGRNGPGAAKKQPPNPP